MSWVRELDARQRAMLDEMGVKVWTPASAPAAASAPAPAPAPAPLTVSAPLTTAPAPAVPAPTPAPAMPRPVDTTAVAGLDWAGLRQAVAACEACGLCASRRQTVFGTGHQQARWMIVGEAPGEQEDRQG